jgi:hypothetical protein
VVDIGGSAYDRGPSEQVGPLASVFLSLSEDERISALLGLLPVVAVVALGRAAGPAFLPVVTPRPFDDTEPVPHAAVDQGGWHEWRPTV